MIIYNIYHVKLTLWKIRLKRLGITQETMSKQLGVTRETLNAIINCNRDPKLSLFDAGEAFLKKMEMQKESEKTT